jgi:hypothetical protein
MTVGMWPGAYIINMIKVVTDDSFYWQALYFAWTNTLAYYGIRTLRICRVLYFRPKDKKAFTVYNYKLTDTAHY